MTLEIEKLTDDIRQMVQGTYERRQQRQTLLERALTRLDSHAKEWDRLESCLQQALDAVDRKRFRAARALDRSEPLNAAIEPPPLPAQATLMATDGSQILPNRHAPYLYSLINIGVIVYFHGRGRAPDQFTRPVLDYPGRPAFNGEAFVDNGALVNLRRDRAEIEVLERVVWDYRDDAASRLALLDQRLLYWPAVGTAEGEGSRVLRAWQAAMSRIRENGGRLAGYIVKPGKQSVLTLLNTLDIDQPGFEAGRLTDSEANLGLTDAMIFSHLLGPGQRSKVFVDVSAHNDDFRENDEDNEVCFFYLNPGRAGQQIARVDIPISVARESQAVADVHSLIVDQCRILGDYPYVLARADEIAVVGRRDQEHLDTLIGSAMGRYGMMDEITAKQSSKEIARAGKTRHQV